MKSLIRKEYCVFHLAVSRDLKDVAKELKLNSDKEAFAYPHHLGFGCGVVYDSKSKNYEIFDSPKEMAKFLLHFDGILVSFNGMRFDLPCLLSGIDIDTFLALQHKTHLDLLADFYDCVQGRFRVGLNNLTENTLKKSNKMIFNNKDHDDMVKYCSTDVKLIKELFEFGVEKGWVLYYDSLRGAKDELSARYVDWLEGTQDD